MYIYIYICIWACVICFCYLTFTNQPKIVIDNLFILKRKTTKENTQNVQILAPPMLTPRATSWSPLLDQIDWQCALQLVGTQQKPRDLSGDARSVHIFVVYVVFVAVCLYFIY